MIASRHDLGLAARHGFRLVMLDRGRVAAAGPPERVLTPEPLARGFHITAHYAMTPAGAMAEPIFQPLGLIRQTPDRCLGNRCARRALPRWDPRRQEQR